MKRILLAAFIILVSVAAVAAGIYRKELRPLYINARTICYSCIGLQ